MLARMCPSKPSYVGDMSPSATRWNAMAQVLTTTNSIYGHWLGQMSHSGDFARWPHLGPIRPMAGGGHLSPLSYVYG